MTEIDLKDYTASEAQRMCAVEWVYRRLGPINDSKWHLRDLRYLQFQDDRDAILFLIKWSS